MKLLSKLFFTIYISVYLTNVFAVNVFTKSQEARFVELYSTKYKIPKDYMKTVLQQAVFQPRSDLFKPHNASKDAALSTEASLLDYQKQFIYPAMINKGVRFMCKHKDAIRKANIEYGVPPEVILGIIGVETAYNENLGRFKVLDTLATIAFNSYRRTQFFQDELAKYILICYKNNWNPTAMRGSIAGAFGITQFMPSSYLNYAVSYTNSTPNLMLANDAILSIANYIKHHGWKHGEPVYLQAKYNTLTCQKLGCNNRALSHRVSSWKQAGVTVIDSAAINSSSMADLVTFSGPKNRAWLALNNFFVIFGYNNSTRYVLTTYPLGVKVVASASKLGCK
ncbi:MAG: lytic murein transglycosylase [Burkholderiales bacterium]|jgi:membrane-bound lytic murein transglycosylase B|nr:lytic murein transglycosylase [Burkholderiales bacterium]